VLHESLEHRQKDRYVLQPGLHLFTGRLLAEAIGDIPRVADSGGYVALRDIGIQQPRITLTHRRDEVDKVVAPAREFPDLVAVLAEVETYIR
jgi:hypothetical protein